MDVKKWPVVAFAVVGSLLIYWSCTESPLNDSISPEPKHIRGWVNLKDSHDDSNVYVWLDGFNISTRTDEDGFFRIEIPKELNEATYRGLNGIFKLYFYVANYDLKTVDVVVRNGLFVYGKGDLHEQGRLRNVVQMNKMLNIKTIVVPKWAHGTFAGPIHVMVTLQAVQDSVTVIYPKSVGGLLGAILLKNVDTRDVYVDIPDVSAKTRAYDVIGMDPKSRRMVFQLNGTNFRDLFLPIGDYIVIPYFLIEHENLPRALIDSIGEDVEVIGGNFLKIPYRREGGQFRIID